MAQVISRLAYVAVAAFTALLWDASHLPARAQLVAPPGFASATMDGAGTTLHYLRGGHGQAVVLLHGFPEDWAEWRPIMSRLATRFTVVALDLPGIGHSAASPNGYDARTLAREVHGLVEGLKLERPFLVGHDVGGIVTYAYVRQFGNTLRGAMIVDVPIPGIAGWEESTRGLWHIGFIQAPKELAERLATARPVDFLGWFYDQGKFSNAERDYYTRVYGAAQLHAGFEIYRAFPRDAEVNASDGAPVATPVVICVGEKSPFHALQPTLIEGFHGKGIANVEGVVISGAGHYVVADNPDGTAEVIERYAGR